MFLKKLVMKNFMPYRQETVVAFPTSPKNNIMLVFGDNMRGKTSLLNAIRWGFYGKAIGRHNKEIDLLNLINSDARDEKDFSLYVAIEFDADGHTFELRRIAKPKELITDPRSSADLEVNADLRIDGRVITAGRIHHEISQIIPETISRFFLFDGELLQEYEDLLSNESDHGQQIKREIEQVLGVPALVNGRNELKALLKKAQAQHANELKHTAGFELQAEAQLKLQKEREVMEEEIRTLNLKAGALTEEIEGLEQELLATGQILKANAECEVKKGELENLGIKEANLKSDMLSLVGEAWTDLLQPRLQLRIQELEKQKSKLSIDIEKQVSMKIEAENLQKLLKQKQCPLCGQPMELSYRDTLGSRLGELEGKLLAMDTDYNELGSIADEIERLSRVKPLGSVKQIIRCESELAKLEVENVKLEGEITTLEDQIKDHDTGEMARQRARKDKLLEYRGAVKGSISSSEAKAAEIGSKLDHLSRQLQSNPAAQKQKSSRLVKILSQLEDIFSQGIDSLRDNLRTDVETHATQAFAMMISERTYKGLKINENYGLQIIDRNNREVSVRSAGAEQIVALSLIDGLNKTGRKAGPIIMDTSLARLDPTHRSNVLSYLNKMASQVVVLVHEGEVNRKTDLAPLAANIGAIYTIKRISSSESNLVKE